MACSIGIMRVAAHFEIAPARLHGADSRAMGMLICHLRSWRLPKRRPQSNSACSQPMQRRGSSCSARLMIALQRLKWHSRWPT